MAAMLRLWAPIVALTVSLAAAEARANPDVWVETTITVAFDEQRVSGFEISWAFDDFYSAHTIQTYDLDKDGTFNPLEVRNLRAETFDPLSPANYFVHIWRGEERQDGFVVNSFAVRIEQARLVYEFSVGLKSALDPKLEPVSVSLFDDQNFVDFSYSDSPFLLVRGEMTPGCTFRAARGTGAQDGHPQPVTFVCEG